MSKKEFEVLTPQMYYILLVLSTPKHGYEIMNEISRLTNDQVKIGAGTLYALLARFESEGYIRLKTVKDRKKIYELTSLGFNKLTEEKERLELQLQLYKEILL